MSFRTKVALLVWISVLSMVVVSGMLLYNMRQDLTDIKRAQIQSVTQSLYNVINNFQTMARDGVISVDDAKRATVETVKNARYGGNDGKSEYFFLLTTGGVAIQHQNEALIGKDIRTRYKFGENRMPVDEILQGLLGKHSAFVETAFPRPGRTEPIDKIEYVMNLEPWGWVLGTGVYVEDIQREFNERVYVSLALICLLIAMQVGFAGWLSSEVLRQVGGEPAKVMDFMSRIADGDLDATPPPAHQGSLIASIVETIGIVRATERNIAGASDDILRRAQHIQDTSPCVPTDSTEREDAAAFFAAATRETNARAKAISDHADKSSGEMVGTINLIEECFENIDDVTHEIKTVAVRIAEVSTSMGVIEARVEELSSILTGFKHLSEKAETLASMLEATSQNPGAANEWAEQAKVLLSSILDSTSSIEKKIDNIQWSAAQAVVSAQGVAPGLGRSAEVVGMTSESLRRIKTSTIQVLEAIREITAAAREQGAVSSGIVERVKQVLAIGKEADPRARSIA